MLSQYTYIICNAATETGRQVADVLLAQNCHIILAGPHYAALSAMEKELNANGNYHIDVALLEPSKEIDWHNLVDSLGKNDKQLAGIVHIHEVDANEQSFFETSYEQFSTIVDDQLWGTFLSAKILTPIFEDKHAGKIIHLVESNGNSLHYSMITRALDALIETLQKEIPHENIEVKYFEVSDNLIENLIKTHVLD